MTLYQQWAKTAYTPDGQSNPKFWKTFRPAEREIYRHVLGEKLERFEFTPAEFAEKFGVPASYACGFAEGISPALSNEIDAESMEDDAKVTLDIDFEKLYKKMIELKADHLYSLPEWESIFDKETLEKYKFDMTKGRVFVRETEKIGRNDLCPCGSGKKYKKCCGLS